LGYRRTCWRCRPPGTEADHSSCQDEEARNLTSGAPERYDSTPVYACRSSNGRVIKYDLTTAKDKPQDKGEIKMAIAPELIREIFKGRLFPFTQRDAVEAAWFASPRCSTSEQPKQPANFATTQVDRRGPPVRCSHPGYLNSVPYLRAISRIRSRVSCFGGMPGGLQVSRKKPSRPAGDMIQSKSSS
jgi:hypothetical protein